MPCLVGQIDDITGKEVGQTAVYHTLANAKGACDGNEHIP